VVSDLSTTCHDFQTRLDDYLDGEVDPQGMRLLAIHASHCASCGQTVEHGEKLKQLLEGAVEEEVARIDTANLWSAIEARLEAPKRRWWKAWKIPSGRDWTAALRLPALALSGALMALLAFNLWSFWFGPAGTRPAGVEVANNRAQIERIESSAPHVAVWSEPEEHTTAIWVASFEP
jgi:anti-sigma factor RsiW